MKTPDSSSADPSPPLIPDHDLIRRIGRGGYGDVWLARTVLGSYRAVKVVYRSRFHDQRPYDREFRGIRRFEPVSRANPSQVAIYHVGRPRGADYFYYVMDLADDVERAQDIDPITYVAKTLSGEIERQGSVPFEECVATMLALTEALGSLHGAGLLHRDIKPSNIIYVARAPKLADIGLVTDTEHTVSMVGTPGFMAPEGSGSQQADIYSLGKVLYEMANGRDRNEFPALPKDLAHRPERAQILELNELVLKACERDPRKRYSSVGKFREDLLALSAGKSLKKSAALKRKLYWSLRLAAVVVMLTAVAAIAIGIRHSQTRQVLTESQSLRIEAAVGQRFEGLKALRRHGRWYLEVPERLHAAAVASLALPDFTPSDDPWSGAGTGKLWVFDDSSSCFAYVEDLGNVVLRRYGEEEVLGAYDSGGSAIKQLVLGRGATVIGALTVDGFFQAWHREGSQAVFPEPVICGVAAMNRDGNLLATIRDDHLLQVYRLSDGVRLKSKYVAHRLGQPDLLSWSADDRLVTIGQTQHRELHAVNVVTLDEPYSPPTGVNGAIVSFAWHPNRPEISIGCANGKLYRWLPELGEFEERRAHGDGNVYVAYLEPSGSLVSHGTVAPHQLKVWDALDGKRTVLELAVPAGIERVHLFDKDRLVVLSDSGSPRIIGRLSDVHHVATRRDPRSYHTPVECLSYSGADTWLASASDGGVTVWPAREQVPRRPASTLRPNISVQFVPEGDDLMICNRLGTHVLPMNRAIGLDASGKHLGPGETLELSGRPIDAAIAKAGSIAVMYSDVIYVVGADGVTTKLEFDGAAELAISPDGRWVAAHHPILRRLTLWDLATGASPVSVSVQPEVEFAFDPGRDAIVIGERERFSWRQLENLSEEALPSIARPDVSSKAFVSFNGNGELVALALSDSEIAVKELPSGKTVLRVSAPDDFPITSLALSPSGSLLSAGYDLGYIQTWDVGGFSRDLSGLQARGVAPIAHPAGPVPSPEMRLTPGHMRNLRAEYRAGLSHIEESMPERYDTRIWFHTKLGQLEEAERVYRESHTQSGRDLTQDALYWRMIGESRLVHAQNPEDLRQAESAFLESIKLEAALSVKSAATRSQLGRVRVALGEFEAAKANFLDSLSLKTPTNEELFGAANYFYLAQCCSATGQGTDAIAYYERALRALERSRNDPQRTILYDHGQKDLWRLLWATKAMLESAQ